MAKKLFVAKALVNITHNFESVKIGETFKITLDDAKELLKNKYIEMIDKLPTENEGENNGEDNNENEDSKGGE